MQRLILTLFTASLIVSATVSAQSVSVTDFLGRELFLAEPATRVVSLMPSHTETVLALEAAGLLVGIDEDSPQPPGAALPRLGSGFGPNLELILELEPDLVLVDQFSGVHEQLNELGVMTFAGMPGNVPEMISFTGTIGTLLGHEEEAALLTDELTAFMADMRSRVAEGAGPLVYVELDPTPFAAGPGSYIDDLLDIVGARNIVPAELGAWPMLSAEFVVASEPDVVILLAAPYGETEESFRSRPGFAQLDSRVIEPDERIGDLLSRPGPGLREALDWLFSELYGSAPAE